MMNPKIVVKICTMRNHKDEGEHVRVVLQEPIDKKDQDRTGPMGIKDFASKIRWFVPASQSFPEFLTANFKFKRDPIPRYSLLDNDAVRATEHSDETTFAIDIPELPCRPHVEIYKLGQYDYEGVTHDVIAFMTFDMETRIITPGYKNSVVYQLNTAAGLAEEAFLDHLHLHLRGWGFHTLYTKKAALKFLRGTCAGGVHEYYNTYTGQRFTVYVDHPHNYRYPNYTMVRATKPDHDFALTTTKDLQSALYETFDWNGQFSISDKFDWYDPNTDLVMDFEIDLSKPDA